MTGADIYTISSSKRVRYGTFEKNKQEHLQNCKDISIVLHLPARVTNCPNIASHSWNPLSGKKKKRKNQQI